MMGFDPGACADGLACWPGGAAFAAGNHGDPDCCSADLCPASAFLTILVIMDGVYLEILMTFWPEKLRIALRIETKYYSI